MEDYSPLGMVKFKELCYTSREYNIGQSGQSHLPIKSLEMDVANNAPGGLKKAGEAAEDGEWTFGMTKAEKIARQ